MTHLSTEQAELLLRLADLLDEMAQENLFVGTNNCEEPIVRLGEDELVAASDNWEFTGDDIRGITA